MNDPIGWMLIGLSFAWGTQAVLAVVALRKLAERAAHPQTERFAAYRPPAALIVPFKGVEPALQANLLGLFSQDYPDYRLVLVVEDEHDPAFPLLQQAVAQHPDRPAQIITAGVASPHEGQKVHNLIAAVEHLQQQNAGEEVWVFADSDAVPGPHWLGELVGPLWQDRTAVTTGFRWLIPQTPHATAEYHAPPHANPDSNSVPHAGPERSEGLGLPQATETNKETNKGTGTFSSSATNKVETNKVSGETNKVSGTFSPPNPLASSAPPASADSGGAGFWAKIASILNSSTTGFIRRESFTHAWGGSMAMRVATAREGDLLSRWRGAISDDYQVTRMCRDLQRRVYFVPECLVASPVDYDFQGLADFAYRQYLITRIHVPFVYFAALAVNALYFLGLAATVTLLLVHPNRDHTLFALGVFAVVFFANQIRATYRRRVVQRTLGPDAVRQLQPTLTLERWTTPLWLGINLCLLIRAGFGRTITWRNIRYRIDAPQKIRKLGLGSGD